MRYLIILLIIVTIAGLNFTECPAQVSRPPKTLTDERAINIIERLPEVKAYINKYKRRYKPAVLLYQKPDNTSKYYIVKVGIDHPDHFETVYNFYVDSRNQKILFLDILNDSSDQEIPIELWRKWRNDPRFSYAAHHFKNGKIVVSKK